LSYLHAQADDTPDYGIPFLFNGPAPVERRNYYGFEHGNYLKTNVDMGTVKFEHAFNNAATFHNQLRYAHYHRDVRITEAQINNATLDAVDPLDTPLDQIGINRNEITVNSLETFLQEQMDCHYPLPHRTLSETRSSQESKADVRRLHRIVRVTATSPRRTCSTQTDRHLCWNAISNHHRHQCAGHQRRRLRS